MSEFEPEVPETEKPYVKYEGEPSAPESTDPLSKDQGHEYHGTLEAGQGPALKSAESKHSLFDVLRKKKFSIPIIIGSTAAAVTLAVGVSRLTSNDSPKQGGQPVATAPVTPGATASPETTHSPEVSANATPPAEVEITSEEVARLESYAPAMEVYKNMDIATFEKQPQEVRLMYAQYIMDNDIAVEEYTARYGKYAVKNQQELAITPVPVSLENTGQEILDNNLLNVQLSFVTGDLSGYDLLEGREVLSAVFYIVGDGNTSTDYLNTIKLQESLDKPTPIGDKYTATDTSDLLTGKIQGKKVQYKIVTYTDQEGRTVYASFVIKKFKGYDDSEKAAWLEVDWSSNSVDDLTTITPIK